MEQFQDFIQDFGILVEVGFVAVKQGDEDCALKLFRAAEVLDPTHSAPKLGFGYIALNKLELKEASDIFEGVVAEEPTNFLASTFLGLCLMLAKTDPKRGESLVNRALEKCTDSSVRHFAQTVLEWKTEFFEKKEPEKFKIL